MHTHQIGISINVIGVATVAINQECALTAFIIVKASFCAPSINVYSPDPKSVTGVNIKDTSFVFTAISACCNLLT